MKKIIAPFLILLAFGLVFLTQTSSLAGQNNSQQSHRVFVMGDIMDNPQYATTEENFVENDAGYYARDQESFLNNRNYSTVGSTVSGHQSALYKNKIQADIIAGDKYGFMQKTQRYAIIKPIFATQLKLQKKQIDGTNKKTDDDTIVEGCCLMV